MDMDVKRKAHVKVGTRTNTKTITNQTSTPVAQIPSAQSHNRKAHPRLSIASFTIIRKHAVRRKRAVSQL